MNHEPLVGAADSPALFRHLGALVTADDVRYVVCMPRLAGLSIRPLNFAAFDRCIVDGVLAPPVLTQGEARALSSTMTNWTSLTPTNDMEMRLFLTAMLLMVHYSVTGDVEEFPYFVTGAIWCGPEATLAALSYLLAVRAKAPSWRVNLGVSALAHVASAAAADEVVAWLSPRPIAMDELPYLWECVSHTLEDGPTTTVSAALALVAGRVRPCAHPFSPVYPAGIRVEFGPLRLPPREEA